MFADAVECSDDNEGRDTVVGEVHETRHPGSIATDDEFFKSN